MISDTKSEVIYRYYVTDLLSNEILGELPLSSVSYSRTNRRPGDFNGSVPFIPDTAGLDLYESTMPGKTGLYVMREGKCVWGGIIWSRSYNAESRQLEIGAAEFLSYLYHRNIWKTIQYGSFFVGVSGYAVIEKVSEGQRYGVILTDSPHGFTVGDTVKIGVTSPVVDGVCTVTAVITPSEFEFETESDLTPTTVDGSPAGAPGTFTSSLGFLLQRSTSGACRRVIDTYDFARDLVYRISTDLGGLDFTNEYLRPGIEYDMSVVRKSRSADIATLEFSEDHTIIVGQEFQVFEVDADLDGAHTVLEVPDRRTIRFDAPGPDIFSSSLSGIRTLNVVSKRIDLDPITSYGIGTITVDQPHNASVGQSVVLSRVDSFFTGQLDVTFTGRFVIESIPTPNSFSFTTGSVLGMPETIVAGGMAMFGSRVLYADYGSFTGNSDLGFAFDEETKSGFYQDTQIFRGFEQRTAGDILEDYSNTVDGGFDYRIDCDYDYETSRFTRTFKLIPIEKPQPPEDGDVYPITEFGAEKLVFEYPGNIMTFSVEESADEAATRFFAVGRIEDLGDEASQPFSGASATDLLTASGRKWPLLDQSENIDKVEDEFTLYGYALDYLYESYPPIANITLSVNGSFDPVVGSYFPGEWCSIIIDDEFMRQRLANDQEPRDDVLIRRIESIKVTVPEVTGYPEVVELELLPSWRVDNIGN